MKTSSLVILSAMLSGCTLSATAQQPAVVKSIADYSRTCVGNTTSSVCRESFAAAIGDAKKYLGKHGDDTYVIEIPVGTFDFSNEPKGLTHPGDSKSFGSAIDVSDIWPRGAGRLIIHGAGKDKTTLITNDYLQVIHGTHVSHVTFAGFTMARPHLSVSQGTIVDATHAGQVTLDIHPGFPTPAELYVPNIERRFLRIYTNSKTDPQLVLTPTNKQIQWGKTAAPQPVKGSSNRWTIYFSEGEMPSPDYVPGALVCIKAKTTNAYQAYDFDDAPGGGTDIVFDDIRWLGESGGRFKQISNLKVLNSEAPRMPAIHGQVPCLSGPTGGPQIAGPTHGDLIDHFYSVGNGDDPIAFFNDNGVSGTPTGSIVRNSDIENSFAREIMLHDSCGVTVENTKIIGCSPILDDCPVTDIPLCANKPAMDMQAAKH